MLEDREELFDFDILSDCKPKHFFEILKLDKMKVVDAKKDFCSISNPHRKYFRIKSIVPAMHEKAI